MNSKTIDKWSILHLIFSFMLTLVLILNEINLNYVFVIIISYEVLEHSFIGDMFFDWFKAKRKESIQNTIFDILIGILGFILAIAFYP
jgi:hypothetical protein